MNALQKLQNDSRYSVTEWDNGEIQVVEIGDEGTDYSIVISHNANSVKLKSRETGFEWEYIPTPKRTITPHKGDESGGRTEQINARITPQTRENLDQILAASDESFADWLTKKVSEEMDTKTMIVSLDNVEAFRIVGTHAEIQAAMEAAKKSYGVAEFVAHTEEDEYFLLADLPSGTVFRLEIMPSEIAS